MLHASIFLFLLMLLLNTMFKIASIFRSYFYICSA